jgi:hypothetical protein
MKYILTILLFSIAFHFFGQQATLIPSQCNTTLAALGTNIYSTSASGAQQYRFRYTLGASSWIHAPGLKSSGAAYQYSNLVWAGTNPSYASTYNVQVDVMLAGTWQNNWGPICTVTTPPMPDPIQLEATFCNSSQSFVTSPIRAQEIVGGTGWRFRVTNTLDGTQSVLTKEAAWGSTRTRRTTNISQVATSGTGNLTALPQAIYQVECAISIQGGPYSAYGNICTITISQPIPMTINNTDCNRSFNYTHHDVINATVPTPSTGCTYQIRLVDQSNSNVITSAVLNQPQVLIDQIPGFAYGKTYAVSAKAIRQGIDGAYGTPCTITTPSQPVTKIQDGQFGTLDNCDINISTFAQRIYAFPIPLCVDYQFEINTNGAQGILYRNTGNIRSFRLSEVPGYVNEFNKTYNIRVRVNLGSGFGPYNDVCTVTTPAAILINNDEEKYLNNISSYLNLRVYPNPSTDDFKIDYVDENLPNSIELQLFDVQGNLIEYNKLNKEEFQSYCFGKNLSLGSYILNIKDDSGKVDRIRLLKIN